MMLALPSDGNRGHFEAVGLVDYIGRRGASEL